MGMPVFLRWWRLRLPLALFELPVLWGSLIGRYINGGFSGSKITTRTALKWYFVLAFELTLTRYQYENYLAVRECFARVLASVWTRHQSGRYIPCDVPIDLVGLCYNATATVPRGSESAKRQWYIADIFICS